MRRPLLLLASLIFSALGSIAAAQIPNVPDTSRYVAYTVTSATTNFDVPFALYGDCSDLTVKIAGVVQTGGFTCISKSLTPFANVAQPVTDAQVQFTSGVTNALVEIVGARHPRFSMGTAPGITRTEFNRSLGTIMSTQRELYDKTIPLGASTMAGFGLPSVGIGASGSYYLDLTTGNVYGPKTNSWPANPAFSPSVFTPLNPNIAFVTGAAGVVCDGVTDANAGGALQAVINNAATAKRRLFFPPAADCHIKTAFSVPSNADWEGFGTTISFDPNVTLANPIGGVPVAMALINTANFRWNGITFNGPGAATLNPGTRIVAQNISNGLILNTTFQNFGTRQAFTGTLTNGSGTITGVSSVSGLVVGMTIVQNITVIGTITAVGTNTVTMTPAATTNGAASLNAQFYSQGFLAFTPTNITFDRSTSQNNSGDGLAFSNNVQGTRILNSRFLNNGDSGYVLCTIGGTNNQGVGNTVSAPSGNISPAIVSERCQNGVIAYNTVNSGAGTAAIRIARYADTADINKDIKIIGNTITGGGNISVESSGTTQGSQTVATGGLFKVIGNTVISPSGGGISVIDSTNGEVVGNSITGAVAEGIFELAFSGNTGNNIISGNTIDGATYCLRQLAAGGTIIKSQYSGNDPRNCSTSARQLVNADYFDRGDISGAAATFPNFTGDVTSSGTTTSYNNIVPVAKGGTNLSTFTTGDLLYASSATVIAKLADVATGNVLRSGGVGVAPAWGKINLSTDLDANTLPAGNTAALTGDVTKTAGSNPTTLVTAQPAVHTWALAQTFTVAPVFTDQPGSRTALGLGTAATVNTGTSGATIPLNNGNNTLSGNNTFQGAIASSVTPSSAWGMDCSGTTTGSIAASGTYTFQAGAGQVTVQGVSSTGATAMFLIGGGVSVLLGQSGTLWANTVTAAKFSLTVSGSSILLTNSTGTAETFQLCGLRIRSVAN